MGSMRHLSGLALLAGLAASVSCACNCYDAPDEDPMPHPYYREEETLGVEEGEAAPLQYAAWCILEARAVGPWTESRGEAASNASEHASKHPVHESYVLWRQAPSRPPPPNAPARLSD